MTALLYAAGVVIFVLALYASIALHELGHLALAKRCGCRVTEYMIGFGPTLWSRTRGETTYGLKLVPLGGFVTIVGMFPPEAIEAGGDQQQDDSGEGTRQVRLRASNTGMFAQMISQTRSEAGRMVTAADSDRLFYRLPWRRKVAVMAAGPVANLLIAFLCFQAVFGIHGSRSAEPVGDPVIASVAECVLPDGVERECSPADRPSPAAAMGLLPGDEVVAFDGREVADWDGLSALIHDHGGERVSLTVLRDGHRVELPEAEIATMARDLSDDGTGPAVKVGYLGAGPVTHEVVTRGGPLHTLEQMGDMAWHSVEAIATMPVRVAQAGLAVLGLEERDPDGPMSVIGGSRLAGEVTAASEAETGLGVGDKAAMLGLLVGGFNLFLGLFNLVPLLPLDGGHILGALWEGIRRGLARFFGRKDPGYVDVAAQMPVAFVLGVSLVVMGAVLMLADLVVPLSTGL